MTPFSQILLAVSIPTIVALVGVIFNQMTMNRLADKIDRHYESFNNQVTTLLTTIHAVDTRVVKVESKGE
jgi:chaperonin cofactor prefoldin